MATFNSFFFYVTSDHLQSLMTEIRAHSSFVPWMAVKINYRLVGGNCERVCPFPQRVSSNLVEDSDSIDSTLIGLINYLAIHVSLKVRIPSTTSYFIGNTVGGSTGLVHTKIYVDRLRRSVDPIT